ncbi:MAG: class I SAM-dependent methyltransferase [Armatimonadetes bacterium]|nr:class I SAM-dependent methyltransferase [Armatimonadota bacterium]
MVIEVGCAQGLATEKLVARAGLVVALDKSAEMVHLARQRLAERDNLKLLEADATDPTWPGLFVGRAELIFLDVGGAAPAKQAIALLRDYRDLYLPRAVVVRNLELADLIGAVVYWEGGAPAEWRKPPIPHLEWPWRTDTG